MANNIGNLIEELKLRMNSAAQQNQDAINDKMLEILEALASTEGATSPLPLEKEVEELRARLAEAETKLKKFAAFDGDGDGRPGGSKPRKAKTETKGDGV